MVNNFNMSVTQIMDDIAPVKIKSIPGKIKEPWRHSENVKALKRTCRQLERKWRKSKLQVDYTIYKDLLKIYNREIEQSRQHFFSHVISENLNNSKVLFNTIDRLVNPVRPIPAELHSSVKCNEFATYFKHKIFNIRNNMVVSSSGGCISSPPSHRHSTSTMSNFSLIQSNELLEGVQ